MFLRILSLAGPLWVYATVAILIYGIVRGRKRFDWFALAPGAGALLPTRRQALLAAILFGATPVCLRYSVSTGTDTPSALMTILGMWGLLSGNGPLAAAGFAFAAQTRLELLVLIPLVWLSPKVPPK